LGVIKNTWIDDIDRFLFNIQFLVINIVVTQFVLGL
jgi:hypothetical protein